MEQMTEQEAIDAIKIDGLEITGNLSWFINFLKGLVVAEEALKKRIPMKMENQYKLYNIFDEGICPSCGVVIRHKYPFCPKCGQKIEWSK